MHAAEEDGLHHLFLVQLPKLIQQYLGTQGVDSTTRFVLEEIYYHYYVAKEKGFVMEDSTGELSVAAMMDVSVEVWNGVIFYRNRQLDAKVARMAYSTLLPADENIRVSVIS